MLDYKLPPKAQCNPNLTFGRSASPDTKQKPLAGCEDVSMCTPEHHAFPLAQNAAQDATPARQQAAAERC